MKSNEGENPSDYLEVMQAVYTDACVKCSADVFDLRDLETIRSRVEHEGLSFLTIVLPRFCKGFERSLELGHIDPAGFAGFEFAKLGAIPVFLQGMLGQVFDRKTGKVIPYEPPTADNQLCELAASDIPTVVEALRQVCRVFAKVELDCTPKRVQAALDSFYEIEQDFNTFSVPDEDHAEFLAVSRLLWDNMFRDFNTDSIVPKHGPGATAERVSGNGKYVWRRWHDRLEPFFPLVAAGYPLGIPETSEELEIVTIVPEHDEQPVKVITVPKTLKSPRVIAIEPVCMQYAQQAIRDYLYDRLESARLTRGRVNFRNQSINQRMALKASRTGRHATIDLSEASDRVPLSLAMDMFGACPDLRDAILACRSTRARLPDGTIIGPLGKFASMGSALCFPVEAMYFYTLCVMALMKDRNLSYTFRNVRKAARKVYVYGDDLIVPKANADAVLAYLHKYNCKVNSDKTFVTGRFRESCGTDAYAGYVVTPTYIRKTRPKNRQQHDRLISWCATANLFYTKGYWRTASLIRGVLEKILRDLPYVRETSGVLGHFSYLGYESIGRWNRKLQRNEVFGWIPSPVRYSDELDGWAALAKCLGMLEAGVKVDSLASNRQFALLQMRQRDADGFFTKESYVVPESHLSESALHGAVTLKRRWAPTH